jgi:hypothetical protein
MLTNFAATLSACDRFEKGPRSYLLRPGQEISVDYPVSIDEDIDGLFHKFLAGAPLAESEALPFTLSKKDLDVLTFMQKILGHQYGGGHIPTLPPQPDQMGKATLSNPGLLFSLVAPPVGIVAAIKYLPKVREAASVLFPFLKKWELPWWSSIPITACTLIPSFRTFMYLSSRWQNTFHKGAGLNALVSLDGRTAQIIEKCREFRKKCVRVTFTPEEWTNAPHQVKTETVTDVRKACERTLAEEKISKESTLHLVLRLRGGMFHKTSGYLLESKSEAGRDLETFFEKMSVRDDGMFVSGHKTQTWTSVHYLDRVSFPRDKGDQVFSAFVDKEEASKGETFVGTTNLSRSYEVTVVPATAPASSK